MTNKQIAEQGFSLYQVPKAFMDDRWTGRDHGNLLSLKWEVDESEVGQQCEDVERKQE